jgi:hypothetical protein
MLRVDHYRFSKGGSLLNKNLFISVASFLSISAVAASSTLACPNLAGNYTCSSQGTLSVTQSGNPVTYVVNGSIAGGLDEVSGTFKVGSTALPEPYPAGMINVSCGSDSIAVAVSFGASVPMATQVTYTQTPNGLSIVSTQTAQGQTQTAPAIQCTKQ